MEPRLSAGDKALAFDQLQPWTAARCHRLLRQLQSRLVALQTLTFENRASAHPSMNLQGVNDENERPPKRIRYTYGQRKPIARSRASGPESVTPPRSTRTFGTMKLRDSPPTSSQVVAPTPLWHKIRDEPETPCNIASSLRKSADIQEGILTLPTEILKELRSMQQVVQADRFRIYEAIFDWLANLLRATRAKTDEPRPKSLFGMCLRKIPECVANIEAWEHRVSKEKRNGFTWKSAGASLELYEQLEGFGGAGRGWRPLKMVIRSHAGFLLSEAIMNGLIESRAASLLVKLCVHLDCTEEAATIAWAAAQSQVAPRGSPNDGPPVEDLGLGPMRDMLAATKSRGSRGAVFATLENLVARGQLPLSWLTEQALSSPWLLSLRALTTGQAAPSAMDFLSTTMALLARKQCSDQTDKNCHWEQTLITIAGAIVAAAMALNSVEGQGCLRDASRLRRQRRLLHVLERSWVKGQHGSFRRRVDGQDASLFVMALARQLTVDHIVDTSLSSLRRQIVADLHKSVTRSGTPGKAQYRQTIALACAIAHFRSRTLRVAGRDSLAEICSKLEGLMLPTSYAHSLRKDVAFLLAQKTKNLADLAFAEGLSAGDEGADHSSTIFSGWRWEAGISEWVQLDSTRTTTNEPGETTRSRNRIRAGERGVGRGSDQSCGPIRHQEAVAGVRARTATERSEEAREYPGRRRAMIEVAANRRAEPNGQRLSRSAMVRSGKDSQSGQSGQSGQTTGKTGMARLACRSQRVGERITASGWDEWDELS